MGNVGSGHGVLQKTRGYEIELAQVARYIDVAQTPRPAALGRCGINL